MVDKTLVNETMTHRNQLSGSRDRMPVVYVGHGSPMNAIEDNCWSRGYAMLRDLVPKPTAILAISAHWYVKGSYVTANTRPPTIHDFGGFPAELYEIEYPASGNVELASKVRDLLGKENVNYSEDWGLDHGIWTVLRWMYPEADVPVVQLSMNQNLNVQQHYNVGRSLAELRDNNILILASGNITHNLRDAFGQMRAGTEVTPGWARRFDEAVKYSVLQYDHEALMALWPNTDDGRLAHPTPEHWLPLLYVAGAVNENDTISFPTEGFDLGSLSMRNIIFG